MPVEASLERQLEELGILMIALGQTATHVAEVCGPGRFPVRARRFDLRPDTAWDLEGPRVPEGGEATPARWISTLRSLFAAQNLARDSERVRALARDLCV